MSRPVILYSYNRPNHFKQVVNSIKTQIGDREIFLFQDGPKNSQDKKLTDHCLDIFTKTFTNNQTIFASSENLGVAFNQKRARDFIFDRSDSAIFVEDDIVLNDYYIDLLENLMDFFKADPDIGMVSCFGESHRNPELLTYFPYLRQHDDFLQFQEINKNYFIHMDHLWAYGFFKSAYERIKYVLGAYYQLLPKDYDKRPHNQIFQYGASLGLDPEKFVTSQDSILSGIMILHNICKISTLTMNAKYIGEIGVHSTTQHYNKWWKHTKPYFKTNKEYFWDNRIKQNIISMCRHKFI
jgi:hypothetical protein